MSSRTEINRNALIISTTSDILELVELMNTLNIYPGQIILQKRNRPDPVSFIGKGKLNEAIQILNKNSFDLVVVNGILKPNQFFNLTDALGKEIYDRIRLILEIFQKRVGSREAALQVELMRLVFEMPILKEYVHRGKLKEHPGFLAGGEYQVDYYLRRARKRAHKLKSELNRVEERRRAQREMRRKKGLFVVSLAGYTNAGKSSLFNVLTDERVPVEKRLFTTLMSTVRAVKQLPYVVMVDTVGFIEGLPPSMIKAFSPTLDEIYIGDLILLVVDLSEGIQEIKRKFGISIKSIKLRSLKQTVVLVGNKIDLIDEDPNIILKELSHPLSGIITDSIAVSARNGAGIDQLKKLIIRKLPVKWEYLVYFPRNIDYTDYLKLFNAKTIIRGFDGNGVLRITAPKRVMNRISEEVKEVGGWIEEVRV